MRLLSIIFSIILFAACNQYIMSDFTILEGEWKVEGKEQYETWEILENGDLKGYAYKMVDGEKVISEELQLIKTGDQITYIARVFNQNHGEPVFFLLNKEQTDIWSFENENHDFPKKIQYRKIDQNTLDIQVLGKDDKGFSYIQTKQWEF